jgi:hypothetical protein
MKSVLENDASADGRNILVQSMSSPLAVLDFPSESFPDRPLTSRITDYLLGENDQLARAMLIGEIEERSRMIKKMTPQDRARFNVRDELGPIRSLWPRSFTGDERRQGVRLSS